MSNLFEFRNPEKMEINKHVIKDVESIEISSNNEFMKSYLKSRQQIKKRELVLI